MEIGTMRVWRVAGVIIQWRNGIEERNPTTFHVQMKKAADAVASVRSRFDDAYVVGSYEGSAA